jgi:DNA gyrase subunit B
VQKESSKIKDQFVRRADTFESSACWVKDKELLDIHADLAGIHKGESALEVCCGTGVVGQRLALAGAKVTGFDISLSMLKHATQKLRFCVNARAEHFPFGDNIFDVVICRQAFHFLDIPLVVKEMRRVVKPSTGRIVISQIVPFGQEDGDWLFQIHRKKQPLLKNFLHEEQLKDLLKNAGCQDIVSRRHYVEEPINNWLKDTFFPQIEIDKIKNMFINAPSGYKQSHKIRCAGGDVFDTMRWVVIRGKKA